MNFQELLQLYPIKNHAWHFDEDGVFVTECSDLPGYGSSWLDPWNRPFNGITHPFLQNDMDSTNEDVYGWRYKTSVAGMVVPLLIIND